MYSGVARDQPRQALIERTLIDRHLFLKIDNSNQLKSRITQVTAANTLVSIELNGTMRESMRR
jgi:hypothetical protein